MGMDVGGESGGLVSDINVTPLVDVMLVLLIIMMVVAPLLQSGVSVSLPKSKHSDLDEDIIKDTSIVVALPEDGKYYLGKEQFSEDDLIKKVAQAVKEKTNPDDKVVYIKAGQRLNYGTVVNVMKKLRDINQEQDLKMKIGLVSEREKDKAAG